MADLELANRLKNVFVSVTSDFPTLDYLTHPAFLSHRTNYLSSTPRKSTKERLSPIKVCGPDAIPNRILKLFASELSEPVTVILNWSLSSGDFPLAWRDAQISSMPKVSPVACDNDLIMTMLQLYVFQRHLRVLLSCGT